MLKMFFFSLFFITIRSTDCKKLGFKCEKCNETSCLRCSSDTVLDNDPQSVTFGRCVICTPNCDGCSSNRTCSKCAFKFGLNSEGKCVSCEDPKCLRCTYNYTKCDICEDNTLDDYSYSPTYGKCVGCRIENCKSCNSAYECGICNDGYERISSKYCQACPENCKRCITNCYECFDGYMLDENKTCIKCTDENCFNCIINDDNEEECQKCNAGFHISSGKCIKNENNCGYYEYDECTYCVKKYGFDENKKCTKCAVDNCISCYDDYKTCDSCDLNYYLNKELNICQKNCLDPNCTSCSNDDSSKCNKCKDNYRLTDFKCEKCTDDKCALCINNKDVCTQCYPGYSLLGDPPKCTKCASLCTNCDEKNDFLDCRFCIPYYGFDFVRGSPNYGKCVKCKDKGCIRCDGDPSVCFVCDLSYNNVNGVCIGIDEDEDNGTDNNENESNTDNEDITNESDFNLSDNNDGNNNNNDDNNKDNSKNNKLSVGAIIGIVVGCVAAIAIIIIIAILIIRCKNNFSIQLSTRENSEDSADF